jgi:ribosomal protein S27E
MSFCTAPKHIKSTRKKHKCVYCWRVIPEGKSAYSWGCADGGEMESLYSCLPCSWWVDNERDNSEHEISAGERMEYWYIECPECKRSNNVGWANFGQSLHLECDNCGKEFARPYGYDEESEFGCDGEWTEIKEAQI